MELSNAGLKNRQEWEKMGYALPKYDRQEMIRLTREAPFWVHFGARDEHSESTVTLTVEGLSGKETVECTHYRIDGEHSNPYAEWKRQGEPLFPRIPAEACALLLSCSDRPMLLQHSLQVKAQELQLPRLRRIFRPRRNSLSLLPEEFLKAKGGCLLPALQQDFCF